MTDLSLENLERLVEAATVDETVYRELAILVLGALGPEQLKDVWDMTTLAMDADILADIEELDSRLLDDHDEALADCFCPFCVEARASMPRPN